MDPDDDGDAVLTKYEAAESAGVLNKPENDKISLNTDLDLLPNYLDADDDGDGVNTIFEGATPNELTHWTPMQIPSLIISM